MTKALASRFYSLRVSSFGLLWSLDIRDGSFLHSLRAAPRSKSPSPASADRGHEPMERRGGKASLGLRSEEHTSELQSRPHLLCRLLLANHHPPPPPPPLPPPPP